MTETTPIHPESAGGDDVLDAVLIGGGIMSATLGALLSTLAPDWSIALFERLGEPAAESSHPWNNAGTGHSGLCELNYMPDPRDGSKAAGIAEQFGLSRRFWSALARRDELDPATFVTATPHVTVVFGDDDIAYLRQRYATLRDQPAFADMEYTEDRAVIAEWAPLLVRGRADGDAMAATRHTAGTDVDFGALTRSLLSTMSAAGNAVRLHREITGLTRGKDGLWTVRGRDLDSGRRFRVRTRFVFVGAGGYALRLLQRAGLPEVRGYGVFPLGAQFLRTDNPDVVAEHHAKVYSQAALGAPPMSVPHLDRREVDGSASLLFGPYATFSTRLLRHGKLTDLFTTLRPHNIVPLVAAGLQNLDLVRFLISELLASRRRKFAQLQRFYPTADPGDWELIQAGQRAQLVKPDRKRGGVLEFGTELVTGADGTVAGLLGASPGASIAPSIMRDLLERCFPERRYEWSPLLAELLPEPAPVSAAR
ncbi:malate dehydrogenase (quinone) [Nocardia rhizosphaerihabitans]|uniref:Probable malate:quinone oxidoreductase n=1 Tax=Nocardia rhizosphaerihabitans TaxID=1691570 RepID=A0ABQ2K3D3_9NOCA|nr:malate dehydrogenase (quinone) [Nocardia rhizosphaerihabitans]GGN66660.1 putative malate:quinone oxidoreductase [Nocardia rhizosphaerihabitans]